MTTHDDGPSVQKATHPWTRFSQSEDLTVRLRNILHDYAFGPGVFRELLQNADDAGARRFALLADGATYSVEAASTSGLLDARLGVWQGPAVCAFNDAEFTDADFEGICRVGASGKRSDHAKIGRYGLGFNTTYHLSDVVSFASRDRFCIFDPHEAYLPEGLPGLQLNLGATEIASYTAQLAPFEAAATTFGEKVWPLRGALFRLPLRTPALAACSQICGESHDIHEVLGVLADLLRNAHELLLFLQSVERIDIYVRSAGCRDARRIGGAVLHTTGEPAAARLRRERQLLAGHLAIPSGKVAARRAGYAFAIDVDVVESMCPTPMDAGSEVGGNIGAGSHCETSAWLVVARAETVSTPNGRDGTGAPAEEELPAQHFGAIAMRLCPEAANTPPLSGQAFCFLPLALATGLPAHISANFALTANRRDLWRRSDDNASSHSTRRAAWNEELLTGTLPRAYADAMELRATGLSALSSFDEEDKGVALGKAVDLLPADVGACVTVCAPEALWASWPASAQGAFEAFPAHVATELFRRGATVLWDECRQRYNAPKSALLCATGDFCRLDVTLRSVLAGLVVSGGKRSIVEVPDRLSDVLAEVKGALWLRPQTLAVALRGRAARMLEPKEADAVVEYLLAGGGAPLSVLHGLRICPLIGGEVGRFEKSGTPGFPTLWWAEDADLQELLPGRGFVDPASATFRMLKPRVANTTLNIRLLNAKALSTLLPAVVPRVWMGVHAVEVLKDVILVDGVDARTLPTPAVALAIARTPKKNRTKNSMAAGAAQTGSQKTERGRRPPRSGGAKANWDQWNDYADWYECGHDWYDDAEYWSAEESWQGQGGDDDDVEPPAPLSLPEEEEEEYGCSCTTVAEFQRVVRRCELLWRVIEQAHEKGTSPLQIVHGYPCVPTVIAPADAPSVPQLLSVQEAARRHALAKEDYAQQDQIVLSLCGVPFVRPGRRLRGALGIDKAATLAALAFVFAERWRKLRPEVVVDANPRLYIGLRPLRIPCAEARTLRSLVRSFIRRGLVPKDSKTIEALPVFETLGGLFAVPLAPPGAGILSPSDEWDEALRPLFADYIVSWGGETGELLAELGRERGGTTSFLADFVAPRVGLLEQGLCVRFLEAVAALGAAPWKRPGAPRDMCSIAQACEDAPLVVFPAEDNTTPATRLRCSALADPGDASIGTLPGTVAPLFPPEAYRGQLALAVMRRAGLRSLMDDTVFVETARAAEASAEGMATAKALLQLLRARWETLKWPSKAYTALGRLRVFPALDFSSAHWPLPPRTLREAISGESGGGALVAALVTLDGPCTLFAHAEVSWTQLQLLDPEVFDGWPAALLRRFGALKDPPPLESVVANLAEAARLWASADAAAGAVPAAAAEQRTERRQGIVAKHLAALRPLSKRSHAMQTMVHHNLARVAFIALDDGSLVTPSDVFVQLHAECADNSGSEDEASAKPSGKRRGGGGGGGGGARSSGGAVAAGAAAASQWSLPAYLRPFRRLLLSLAGPGVTGRKAPTVHVGAAPEQDRVPRYLSDALDRPELADVEFVLHRADGVERKVYAHRLVLGAACEHFYATFTSGCSEAMGVIGGRCRIDLPDWVEPRPLLWLLAYLYQGFDPQAAHAAACRLEWREGSNIERDTTAPAGPGSGARGSTARRRPPPRFASDPDIGEDLCCLLRLSDLYGLGHLKRWSEHRLQSLLGPENLVAVSTHAFFCNASQLLALCVYHMQLLYSELVGTAEWENLEPAIRDQVLLEDGEGQEAVNTNGATARTTGSSKGDSGH